MASFEVRAVIAVLFLLGLMALLPEAFTWHQLNDTSGLPLAPPDWGHPLGTDALGRDAWTRLVYATRYSLLVGLLASLIALVLGVCVGLLAGSATGWISELLMRLTDLADAIPGLLLALFLVALWGSGLVQISFALGLVGWTAMARVLRARLLSVREEEFILAARAIGVRPLRLAFSHLLPHAFAPLLVLIPFRIEISVVAEASLSFLGLGDLSRPSLGTMLHDAQPLLRECWWLLAGPGAMLLIIVFAPSVLADHLQQWTEPRLRRRLSASAVRSTVQPGSPPNASDKLPPVFQRPANK